MKRQIALIYDRYIVGYSNIVTWPDITVKQLYRPKKKKIHPLFIFGNALPKDTLFIRKLPAFLDTY